MQAGVEIFIFQSVSFSNTDRGLRVKTRRGRGKDSVLKGIVFEDLELEGVKAPFVVNSFYFCDPDGRTEYVGNKRGCFQLMNVHQRLNLLSFAILSAAMHIIVVRTSMVFRGRR